MPIEPFLGHSPLRFRAIPDSLATSHVEASECCLIHADNPLSSSKGIFVNPNVKVGYSGSAYDAMHTPNAVMSPVQIFISTWESRILRWFTTPILKDWIVHRRVKKWSEATKHKPEAEFCLVNEMQVIFERGWKHM